MQIGNELNGYKPNLLSERKIWNDTISCGLIPIPIQCSLSYKNISINP